jgi:hypothetical protein
MIADRPINAEEDKILKLVKKYSGGNPYITIFYSDINRPIGRKYLKLLYGKS